MGNLVIDSHIQNEGNGWAGSGANPWHLDDDTESILFLTNESDQLAHFGFKVTANGSAPYYLTKLLLNPHETRAIDIRKLRDAQRPDPKGNLIPAGATDGSVLWIRGDNLPVMGRMMQIHRKQGMASNYDCCFCGCPYNYTPSLNYMNPISLYLWVASEGGFAFEAGYEDCNRAEYWYDYTTSASWTSGNPSIASMQGTGLVKGVSGGTASISASYSGYTYTFNGSVCIASPPLNGGGSGPGNVKPKITSISPALGLIGANTSVTISGSGFGASRGSSTVNAGTGITFTYNSWSDTQIGVTFQVASNATSGSHNVTVTTAVGTSNNDKTFYVQVPTLFSGLSVTQTDLGCAPNTAGIGAKVQYQVLDQATQGNAVLVAGMTPQEHFTVNGTPAYDGFKPFATPQNTDAQGEFTDIPVGTCFGPPVPQTNICVDAVQTFNIVVGTSTFSINTTTTRRDCVQGIRVQISPGSTYTIGTVN